MVMTGIYREFSEIGQILPVIMEYSPAVYSWPSYQALTPAIIGHTRTSDSESANMCVIRVKLKAIRRQQSRPVQRHNVLCKLSRVLQ